MENPQIAAQTPHFISVMCTLDDEDDPVHMHDALAGFSNSLCRVWQAQMRADGRMI